MGASAIVRPAPGLLPPSERAGLPAGPWWRFTAPREVLSATRPDEVPGLLLRVDEATVERGVWAVGFVAYEAGSAFDPALPAQGPPPGVPAAWFALFDRPAAATAPAVVTGPILAAPPTPSVDEAAYENAVGQVLSAIERGDTYQANLTYRLDGSLRPEASPEDLFWRLVAAQETELAAFLDLGAGDGDGLRAVASATPELFVRRERERLVCRPMKGTARRGRTLAEDEVAMERLRTTPKERAENVMILDMVRNDLARLVGPGMPIEMPVAVTELCTVERYPTVLQMISEAEARFPADQRPSLADTFRALFPYASITGAPKVSTSRILALLETTPRGVYTGAVGVVAPGGDARFGVAIRTASIRGDGQVSYGTGGGIVWDSTAQGELAESRAKGRIFVDLAGPMPEPFELLETLAWRPEEGFVLLERHLERLDGSLEYFGGTGAMGPTATTETARRHLEEVGRCFDDDPHARRVRLLVGLDGGVRSEVFPLGGSAGGPARVRRLVLGPEPVDDTDPFLFHKTTHREVYARARTAAEAAFPGVPFDDVLLVNRRGELTESTLANLVLRLDGELVTPPVGSGLLPGTLRSELLDRGRIAERVLRPDDLARAEDLYLINSVRGWMPARRVGHDELDD